MTYYDAKLFECWPAVFDVGPAFKQHLVNVSCLLGSSPVIISRPNTATLTNCWASVVGGVPALKQRWLHVIVQRYARLPVWSVCPRGIHNNTQLTQGDVESMLVQRLSTIYDVGPTLRQLLIQRLVFAGLPIHMYGAYIICLSATHCPTKQTLSFIDDNLTLKQKKKPNSLVLKNYQAMHSLILPCLMNLIAICKAPEVTFKLGYYCFQLNIKILTD